MPCLLNAAIESLIPAVMKRLFFDDAISRSHAEQRKSPSDSLNVSIGSGLGICHDFCPSALRPEYAHTRHHVAPWELGERCAVGSGGYNFVITSTIWDDTGFCSAALSAR